ncbi:MAG: hypothetical protein WBM40_20030, partial [Thiohalocapsa sp.]
MNGNATRSTAMAPWRSQGALLVFCLLLSLTGGAGATSAESPEYGDDLRGKLFPFKEYPEHVDRWA